jgi:hypothetical protein
MTAAPPPLAPELAAGLPRLKLAAMRQLAPELLITAKTQRGAPARGRTGCFPDEWCARAAEHRTPGDVANCVDGRVTTAAVFIDGDAAITIEAPGAGELTVGSRPYRHQDLITRDMSTRREDDGLDCPLSSPIRCYE